MQMMRESVWLEISATPASAGACDLCAAAAVILVATATVKHRRGGTVQFSACERCARAVRRIIAAIGSDGQVDQAITQSQSVTAAEMSDSAPKARSNVAQAQLVFELSEQIVAPDGKHYVPQIFGGVKSDGMWAGWIEFLDLQTGKARRTRQETTQGSLEDLRYWATGLGPAFFEGAFARAR
jgi:hypothetical protein